MGGGAFEWNSARAIAQHGPLAAFSLKASRCLRSHPTSSSLARASELALRDLYAIESVTHAIAVLRTARSSSGSRRLLGSLRFERACRAARLRSRWAARRSWFADPGSPTTTRRWRGLGSGRDSLHGGRGCAQLGSSSASLAMGWRRRRSLTCLRRRCSLRGGPAFATGETRGPAHIHRW